MNRHATISLILCLSSCAYAQVPPQQHSLPVGIEESLPDYYKRWSSQQWKGNDAPFKEVKESVNRKLLSSSDKNGVINSYRIVAKTLPQDAIAQFRWGYAVFQTYKTDIQQDGRFHEPKIAMARVAGASNYEFLRLRFLLESKLDFIHFM